MTARDAGTAGPPLAATERWHIDAACRDTIARAARLADQGDALSLAALFTEDAELQRPGGAVLHGRAAIAAAYARRPASRISRHLLATPLVDVDSPDEARAHTLVLLALGDAQDPSGPQGRPWHGALVMGCFEDQLRRCPDGHWRLWRRQARFEMHGDAQALPTMP
jgi:hypothetical protein